MASQTYKGDVAIAAVIFVVVAVAVAAAVTAVEEAIVVVNSEKG